MISLAGEWHRANGTADGNTTTINGFTQINDHIAVYGGGAALNNRVNIASGSTNNFGSIYGGYATSGDVTGNTVTIDGGGQIGTVTGGRTASGHAGGSAAGNVINITGRSATINSLTGGSSYTGFANHNEA